VKQEAAAERVPIMAIVDRAFSTYNQTLERWETTVTPPPSSFQTKIRPQPKAPRR
jgi:hypothetical protein